MRTDTTASARAFQALSCTQFLHGIRREQGGVVQMVLDVCHAMARRGHQVTLLTCDAADVPTEWRQDVTGLPKVVELEPSRFPSELISSKGVEDATAVLAASDVVHLHTPWSLSNIRLARRLCSMNKPYVVTIHGMLDDWSINQKRLKKLIFLQLLGNRFLTSAARIQFTAEHERDQVLPRFPSVTNRSSVVPCCFDLTPYDHMPDAELAREAFPGFDRKEPTVLYLSRVHHKKGIELLIDAAAVARDNGVPFQVLIAGPGEPDYLRSLEKRAADRQLSDRTHFLGMVRGNKKLALYHAADVFCLPTQHENFGIVLTEALACGTPVVTTRGTAIWEEIEEAGGVIVPRHTQDLASALATLLGDASLRQQRGQQGREYVYEWLAADRVGRQYEQLYLDAIDYQSTI